MKRWWKLPDVLMEIKIGRRIKYSSWDSFIRSFNPGKQVRFYPKEIDLFFHQDGTRIVFQILGGSTRTMGMSYKDYKVEVILPFSLFDVFMILWDRKHIYQERPRVRIELLDVSQIFARGWTIQTPEAATITQIELNLAMLKLRKITGTKPEKRKWLS